MNVRVFGPLARREARWCVACNRWGTRRVVRNVFAAVSRLGDGMFWYALMAALIVFCGMDGLRASAHLAITGAAALLLYKCLKHATRRPRPCASNLGIRALVRPLDEFSFPSGHTLHAVSFTGVALAHYPALGWVLLPFCASVAISRVVLTS